MGQARRGRVPVGDLPADGLDRERVQDVHQAVTVVEEAQRIGPPCVPEVLTGGVEQVHQFGATARA